MVPPAKRRKKEKPEEAFFLDTFPSDVLVNIMKFFSCTPYAKNWQSHIDVGNLLKLFAVRGELGCFMKTAFKALCIGHERDSCEEEPHLWTDNIDIALAFILAGVVNP